MGIDRNLSWGQDKFLSMPMGSVRDQNCNKGFHFKEKVEKNNLSWGALVRPKGPKFYAKF